MRYGTQTAAASTRDEEEAWIRIDRKSIIVDESPSNTTVDARARSIIIFRSITLSIFVTVAMFIGLAVFKSPVTAYHSSTTYAYVVNAAAAANVAEQSYFSTSNPMFVSDGRKPNFIFFLADDLPWNAIGYQNFDFSFVTPHLSKFAKSGIIMNNYYAQEICTPSRASLLTGRYPASIGRQYSQIEVTTLTGLDLGETLISEVLKGKGGYSNYIIGKWNMGNSDVRYLPTHRGFDNFFGYVGGGVNPFTKTPDSSSYLDLMYADQQCYNLYDGADFGDYTETLFRNKAIDAIQQHDFDGNPMFLYLAFHGVHAPYDTSTEHIGPDDIGAEMFDRISTEISNPERRKMAAVLALMDQSIGSIYDAMVQRGQAENTYFIFASDNGGCTTYGGFNGPLRGSKGSLFEGGVKVDAMMWGNVLPAAVRGSQYNGLMHTSDWFPTILSLAGIDYQYTTTAISGAVAATTAESTLAATPAAVSVNQLDGISQAQALLEGWSSDFPRRRMLYNVYFNVPTHDFSLDSYTQAAVRNERYKLIYVFVDNDLAKWYDFSSKEVDFSGACDPQNALSGSDFQMLLFDLKRDPYETTNLYGSKELIDVQLELTADLEAHAANAAAMASPLRLMQSEVWFAANGNFAQPWLVPPSKQDEWPSLCSKNTVFRQTSTDTAPARADTAA